MMERKIVESPARREEARWGIQSKGNKSHVKEM